MVLMLLMLVPVLTVKLELHTEPVLFSLRTTVSIVLLLMLVGVLLLVKLLLSVIQLTV